VSELKPCPFCNKTNKLRVLSEGQINAVFGVVCYNCCCQFHCRADSETDAKIVWNTRPIEDALRAEIDQLKHQVANLEQQLYFKHLPAAGVEG